MALELIVNVLLMAASFIAFWYVGATMPVSQPDEMGAEQWPQILLGMLIIAIGYNIFNYFRKNKKDDIIAALKGFLPGIIRLVRSKLFVGMIFLVALGLLYEPLGFLATCFLFMISYGFLLGARKPLPLILSSLAVMFILYMVFAAALGVMLPRGYVPFLRSIAYFLESIVMFVR